MAINQFKLCVALLSCLYKNKLAMALGYNDVKIISAHHMKSFVFAWRFVTAVTQRCTTIAQSQSTFSACRCVLLE